MPNWDILSPTIWWLHLDNCHICIHFFGGKLYCVGCNVICQVAFGAICLYPIIILMEKFGPIANCIWEIWSNGVWLRTGERFSCSLLDCRGLTKAAWCPFLDLSAFENERIRGWNISSSAASFCIVVICTCLINLT